MNKNAINTWDKVITDKIYPKDSLHERMCVCERETERDE